MKYIQMLKLRGKYTKVIYCFPNKNSRASTVYGYMYKLDRWERVETPLYQYYSYVYLKEDMNTYSMHPEQFEKWFVDNFADIL